jgi:hypothetical protein
MTFSRNSTKTYIGSDGLAHIAAVDVCPLEYDPTTLAAKGRSFWPARTNLLLRSTLAGGGAAPTGWTQPIGTGSSAPVTSALGTADGAVAYSQSASGQRPFLQGTFNATVGATYVLSCQIESVTGALTFRDVGTFNVLDAQSFRIDGADRGGFDPVTAGRLEVIVTASASGPTGVRLGPGCSGVCTGTLIFSRPMVEAAAFASPWIPTTTATVPRAVDKCGSLDIGASLLMPSPAEATLYLEAYGFPGAVACSLGQSSSAATGFLQWATNGRFQWVGQTGGTIDIVLTSANGAMSNGVLFKFAVGLRDNAIAAAVNGVSIGSDSLCTAHVGPQIGIGGSSPDGGNVAGIVIRKIKLYRQRLSDAQLAALTA